MARSKYTTGEVFTILREVDHLCRRGKTVGEALKCVAISESLYYRWREKYGWMAKDEYQRMKELEDENERLRALMQLWVRTLGESDSIVWTE